MAHEFFGRAVQFQRAFGELKAPNYPPHDWPRYFMLCHAIELAQLSRTHATLLEALNRHRGKGAQRVTVEHVHVHEGGQAIVDGPSFGSLARSAGQHGALSFCEDRLFAGAVEGVNVSSRPPWNAEETDACFIVQDSTGRALAYAYYEEEPGRRTSANLLTKDEARPVASNIAKLPNFRMGGARS